MVYAIGDGRLWIVGLLVAGAACGTLPPKIGEDGGESMTEPPDPEATTGVGPTTGITTVTPQCVDDAECGECGYCDQGQCGQASACCAYVPTPAGGVEWRCQPPEAYCGSDDECEEGYFCGLNGCEFVPPISDCERLAFDVTELALQGPPEALLLLDVDVDDDLDLVAVTAEPAAVEVFLGDGAGALVSAGAFPTGLVGPVLPAAADLDLDGDPDLALLSPGGNAEFSVLLGQAGGFGAPSVTALAQLPTHIFAGRFDADERPDLVFATGVSDPPLTLLPGDGAGKFGAATTQGLLVDSLAPSAAADLDGDGTLELVAGVVAQPGVHILDHTLDLGFVVASAYSSRGITSQARALIGDLDGDDAPEIVGSRVTNGFGVVDVWRTLDPMFSQPIDHFAVPFGAEGLALGDVDGDAAGDLIARQDAENGALRLVYGGLFGEFACSQEVSLTAPATAPRVVAGDLDGDGRAEIVVGAGDPASARVLVPKPL